MMSVAENSHELRAPAELGNRAHVFVLVVRRHGPHLGGRNYGIADFRVARQPGFRRATDLGENGCVGRLAVRLFSEHGGFLLIGLKKIRATEKGLQTRVVALRVIVNARMIVALRATHVAPEKNAADLARQRIGIALALETPAVSYTH